MSITINDTQLITEFSRADGTIEIRTPDGRYLGEFTPAKLKIPPLKISEEELQRREADRTSKTYTAAEVEAKLRAIR
jgi:hypothetical protein